jgi:uncharacterized membrane protein YeiH
MSFQRFSRTAAEGVMFGLSAAAVTVVEIVAVFTGALSGALLARQRGYDIVGMAGLGFVSGLGGSITRDVLLQQGTPLAFGSVAYLVTVAVAVAGAWFLGERLGRFLDRTIVGLDAVGLGWFAVAGTLRCLHAGLADVAAVVLGTIGAVGGGVVRDVLIREVPAIFRRGELYTLAAVAGIVVLVVGRAAGLGEGTASSAGIAVGVGLRLASVRFGWLSPAPANAAAASLDAAALGLVLVVSGGVA